MGMFSCKCKGCGNELVSGEVVRLNGCRGLYDGYGGAGGFQFASDEPSGWHDVCWRMATDAQKLDETPSEYAPDQGFGPKRLLYMPCVIPHSALHVKAVRLAADTNLYFLTANGIENQTEWDEKERNTLQPYEPWEALGPEPVDLALSFATIDDALEAAKPHLEALQVDHCPVYLTLFGSMTSKEGSIYELKIGDATYDDKTQSLHYDRTGKVTVLYDCREQLAAMRKHFDHGESCEHAFQDHKELER